MPCLPDYGEEEEFLNSLGLGDYVTVFKEEELTINLMLNLREDQLKELGLRMGQRIRFINAATQRLLQTNEEEEVEEEEEERGEE